MSETEKRAREVLVSRHAPVYDRIITGGECLAEDAETLYWTALGRSDGKHDCGFELDGSFRGYGCAVRTPDQRKVGPRGEEVDTTVPPGAATAAESTR